MTRLEILGVCFWWIDIAKWGGQLFGENKGKISVIISGRELAITCRIFPVYGEDIYL